MQASRSKYLRSLGIYEWLPRHAGSASVADGKQAAQIWEELQQQIAQCTLCELHKGRTNTVFGIGNPEADLMFIGEAPGFHEDQQGKPFVGRAGLLLNAMLKAIQLIRDDVFIANVLKCRPPNNRDPLAAEVQTCTPYLEKQIACVQPKLLVALGRVAAHYLLQTKNSLESMRNKIHYFGERQTPLIVTYHPAYLLRTPGDKKKSYQDLLFIKQTLKNL